MTSQLATPGSAEPVTDFSDELLSWFATQNIPMLEQRLSLGGLDYFHFSSAATLSDERTAGAFGSAVDRKTAALKCVGELIERRAMANYFAVNPRQLPKEFHNSNGWAVHTKKEIAVLKATNEATERHLLLKSFFKLGWQGFNPIQTIESQEMRLSLFTSHFTTSELIAGVVLAQSKDHLGVSFGYCVGPRQDAVESSFWQPAIFEAADKIIVLAKGATPYSSESPSWFHREIGYFLNNHFEMGKIRFGDGDSTTCEIEKAHCYEEDLREQLGLTFPLYAAYVFGGNLIPLFHKADLDSNGKAYLEEILQRNDIFETPDRHPIL